MTAIFPIQLSLGMRVSGRKIRSSSLKKAKAAAALALRWPGHLPAPCTPAPDP